MKFVSVLWVLIFFLISCSKKLDSVETLSEFIHYRTTQGQSIDKIKSYLTGPFLKNIEEMKQADLEKFLKAESDKVKFSVLFKRCEENNCSITYEVKYTSMDRSGILYKVESKKIAEMQLENEHWKVSNITNVKSYLEGQEITTQ